MVVIKLSGGLGNQMFQYAAARTLADKKNENLILDISTYQSDTLRVFELESFNIRASILNEKKWFINFLLRNIFRFPNIILQIFRIRKEESLLYDEKFFKKNYYLIKGYFQTEKYFLNNKKKLLNDFTLKNNDIKVNCRHNKGIPNIAVHVRLGDYLFDKKNSEVHGICSLKYYKRSIKKMREIYGEINLICYSDDIEWCKKNLSEIKFDSYINPDSGSPSSDLIRMSYNDGFIISNSTFSWWAAWISNSSRKIVIAPSPWFKNSMMNDIIPDDWISVER